VQGKDAASEKGRARGLGLGCGGAAVHAERALATVRASVVVQAWPLRRPGIEFASEATGGRRTMGEVTRNAIVH
jgi:hypothetical protein